MFRIVVGSCECGNEPLCSIKCVELLDYPRNLLAPQELPLYMGK